MGDGEYGQKETWKKWRRTKRRWSTSTRSRGGAGSGAGVRDAEAHVLKFAVLCAARLWALADGLEAPENMVRCMSTTSACAAARLAPLF